MAIPRGNLDKVILVDLNGNPYKATGVTTFTGLTDGPGAFTGHALDLVRVNATATALEYLDNNFLTAETDPVFSGSPAFGIASGDITNWDTAYGWGDHAGLYDTIGTASGLVGTHESTYEHPDAGTAAGQMLFWTGSQWTHTETSELFWNDTNKRLGINSSSPTATTEIIPTLPTDKGLNVKAQKINPTIIDPSTLTADIYAWFTQAGLSSQVDGAYGPTWTSTVGEAIVLSTWSSVKVAKSSTVLNNNAYVTTQGYAVGAMRNYGSAPTPLAREFTVILVAATYGASGPPLVSFSASDYAKPQIWANFYTPTSFQIVDGATSQTVAGGVKTKFSVVTGIFGSTQSTVYTRGVTSGTPATATASQLENISLFSNNYDGDAAIAEIIIFSKALSTAEREGVEAWLCEKYGLSYNGGTQQTGDLLNLTNAVGDPKFRVNSAGKLTQYAENITDTIWEPSVLGETYSHFAFSGEMLMFGDGTQALYEGNTGNRNWFFQSFNSGINLLPTTNSPAGVFAIRTPGGSVGAYINPLYSTMFTPQLSVGEYDITPDARIDVATNGATTKGIIVKGYAAQSANLQEWQDSSGNVLARIDNLGNYIGGSIYGSMYGDNISQTVTISVADTHYEVGGGLSGGGENLMTFQNSKEIKCTVAGKYMVNYNISVQCANANQEIESGVMVNSTTQANTTAHTDLMTANSPISMGGSGILTLAVNDVVKFCISNHTGTNNLTVSHATMTLTRVGN